MGGWEEPNELLKAALDRQPLFELLETSSASRADLQDALDVSRSTAHRVAKQFESAGLISYQNGRYELTPLGRVVGEQTRRAKKTVTVAQRLAPLLPTLALDDGSFEYTAFFDTDVVTPQAGDPYRPIRRLIHKIDHATSVRELSPTMPEPSYLETLCDRVREGLCASIVFPRHVADRLRQTEAVALEAAIDTGSLRVRIGELPTFRLIVADDCVNLIGYNDDASRLDLVAQTESAGAFHWATTYFQDHWDEATPYEDAYEDAFMS
jgi:predicted transcriptional regulator